MPHSDFGTHRIVVSLSGSGKSHSRKARHILVGWRREAGMRDSHHVEHFMSVASNRICKLET